MNTKDKVLAFTLDRDAVRAALVGDEGKEILFFSCPFPAPGAVGTEDMEKGLQEAFKGLCAALGEPLREIRALVIHDRLKGFIPFDRTWLALGPYRNSRSADTADTAAWLSSLFDMPVGAESLAAHLYLAMRQGEGGLDMLNHICTPQAWLCRKLTGQCAVDAADAEGIFPLLPDKSAYDPELTACFNALIEADGYPWRLQHILPEIRPAGEAIGSLTPEGAFFIDHSCYLRPGVPVLG